VGDLLIAGNNGYIPGLQLQQLLRIKNGKNAEGIKNRSRGG
jgi:hypothetical protein